MCVPIDNPPLLPLFRNLSCLSPTLVVVVSSSIVASSSNIHRTRCQLRDRHHQMHPISLFSSIPFLFVFVSHPRLRLRRIDSLIPISFSIFHFHFHFHFLSTESKKPSHPYSSSNLGLLWPLICLFLPFPSPRLGHSIVTPLL